MAGAPIPVAKIQARSVRRRQAITDAALKLFVEQTHAATTMDDICARAECSKGGLYHHFRTKDAVLAAVVVQMTAIGAMTPPLAGAAQQLAVRVSQLEALVLEIWAEASRSEELRRLLASSTPLSTAELIAAGDLVEAVTRAADEAAARRAA